MPNLTDEDKVEAAHRVFAALNGAPEDFRSVCVPESLAWHNFDEIDVPVDGSVASSEFIQQKMPDMKWELLAAQPTPNGFVSQAVLTGTVDGKEVKIHACQVATLTDDGLICRVEEYLDSFQARLLAP